MLVESVSKISVEAKGNVTLLYSGYVNNSRTSSLVGLLTADQEESGIYHYRTLNSTEAYKLLTHVTFAEAHARSFGYENVDVMNDELLNKYGGRTDEYWRSEEMAFTNDARNGLWAKASDRFVAAGSGSYYQKSLVNTVLQYKQKYLEH